MSANVYGDPRQPVLQPNGAQLPQSFPNHPQNTDPSTFVNEPHSPKYGGTYHAPNPQNCLGAHSTYNQLQANILPGTGYSYQSQLYPNTNWNDNLGLTSLTNTNQEQYYSPAKGEIHCWFGNCTFTCKEYWQLAEHYDSKHDRARDLLDFDPAKGKVHMDRRTGKYVTKLELEQRMLAPSPITPGYLYNTNHMISSSPYQSPVAPVLPGSFSQPQRAGTSPPTIMEEGRRRRMNEMATFQPRNVRSYEHLPGFNAHGQYGEGIPIGAAATNMAQASKKKAPVYGRGPKIH